MQVSEIDNVKIYNLSAGKSLPEWLSERKRRAMLKKNIDIRRRIELIQDFSMPGLSSTIKLSADGQYILATGIYKPRLKCYEVSNLSLKFERCLDSEVVTFEVLSDDYSKVILLQYDRYVEFHVAHGRHYRLRVPRFGRDLAYHKQTCDTYVVGASSDVYRLNLEVGQFMAPLSTNASSINKCVINSEHGLVVLGTHEGQLEAWDPRSRTRQGILDCAVHCADVDDRIHGMPSISALTCHGGLLLGAGTSTGHIILYDIRSSKPLIVKDHMNDLPIKDIVFHKTMDYVYSMDSSILKIWDRNNAKQFTSIESPNDLNNLCVVPGSGLLFMAQEDPKMLSYYIPALGPAPRWCAFLDNLTEELESTSAQDIYDDYKFVTRQELDTLGLGHLLGTNLLRAYMHGYFMDVRLYKKAKSISDPFAFEEFKRRRIRERLEQERPSRLQLKANLPSVNRELAAKLMSSDQDKKNKNKSNTLLTDDRFKALFANPDFEVDKTTEEYRLLNPVLSNMKLSKAAKKSALEQFEPVEEPNEPMPNSDDELFNDSNDNDSSSDDEHTWTQKMKNEHQLIKKQQEESAPKETSRPKFYELKAGQDFQGGMRGIRKIHRRVDKSSLGDRLKRESNNIKFLGSVGNREMTFRMNKDRREQERKEHNRKHQEDRKKVHRPTNHLARPRFKPQRRR
ncbi:nucleolar protein 10 lethal (2) 34Fd [Arctopsyche grandis]|uniref:nucleolar protein 10 lethal (2) 34Fd n=1 Tax=Arctopsyche grandis TaxID=121162 RepID=UPI00406D965C